MRGINPPSHEYYHPSTLAKGGVCCLLVTFAKGTVVYPPDRRDDFKRTKSSRYTQGMTSLEILHVCVYFIRIFLLFEFTIIVMI